MKIVHLCLGCFFPDNYSYQENMLPKFHKQMGYEVEVIASLVTFDKDGKGTFLKKGSSYINEYGIPVTRLDYKKPVSIYRKLKRYIGTYDSLKKAKPDILFIHGCQFMDMDQVVKYLKLNPNTKVYVDNHADFSNSATNFLSLNILHKLLWKHSAQIINPYTTKFFGVLPARVDFLKNIYKLPANKCELLVMGADDDKIKKLCTEKERERIRNKFNIKNDEFLIVTGGKIDMFKRQTIHLMNAVKNIENKKVKLIVFGSIVKELKEEVMSLSDGNKIQYIGWANDEESYKYFNAADLVVFPGRHSVYWEQVVAIGVPMICKYWEGTQHIDIGGNVLFLKDDSPTTLKNEIQNLLEKEEIYNKMKENAHKPEKNRFRYSDISRKCIIDSNN